MRKNFLITTGGSGGHVLPAQIIFEHLSNDRDVTISTDTRGLKYLEKDIVNFEPKLALSGGYDGFSKIRKVINKANCLIKKNGKFILEIGFNQKNKVKEILKQEGFYINKAVRDYGNNDRCIISTKI